MNIEKDDRTLHKGKLFFFFFSFQKKKKKKTVVYKRDRDIM